MRHLSVPCKETSLWIQRLRELGWIAQSTPVIKINQLERAIPLSTDAPLVLPAPFSRLSIIELEVFASKDKHYLDNLEKEIGKERVEKLNPFWPKSYDYMGDLILFKTKKEVEKYSFQIGKAMLERNPNSRVALLDEGVFGEYRIRKLKPLAIKCFETQEITVAESDISTKTIVKENGFEIIVDPQKAYYSPRLSNERIGTLETARTLSNQLGRPLNIIDPYSGVGPSIIPLISEEGLVANLYASDINPQAIDLLKENIDKNGTKKITGDAKISVEDARKLPLESDLCGKFDLILINIPHDSIEHLSHLFPLLALDKKSIIRGWALTSQSEIHALESKIKAEIEKFNPNLDNSISINQLKSYSVESVFVRFEIYFESESAL